MFLKNRVYLKISYGTDNEGLFKVSILIVVTCSSTTVQPIVGFDFVLNRPTIICVCNWSPWFFNLDSPKSCSKVYHLLKPCYKASKLNQYLQCVFQSGTSLCEQKITNWEIFMKLTKLYELWRRSVISCRDYKCCVTVACKDINCKLVIRRTRFYFYTCLYFGESISGHKSVVFLCGKYIFVVSKHNAIKSFLNFIRCLYIVI